MGPDGIALNRLSFRRDEGRGLAQRHHIHQSYLTNGLILFKLSSIACPSAGCKPYTPLLQLLPAVLHPARVNFGNYAALNCLCEYPSSICIHLNKLGEGA